MKKFFILKMLFLAVGCATPQLSEKIQIAYAPMTSNNFRSKIETPVVERKKFYNARLIDSTKRANECFPAPNKPLCSKFPGILKYGAPTQIDAESLSFGFQDGNHYFPGTTQELTYLVAAELTIQRGFKFFLIESIYYDTSCRNNYSATTTGFISNNNYFGNTTLNNTPSCLSTGDLRILMFDNYDDIKKGVFIDVTDPNGNIRYEPHFLLYRNLDFGGDTQSTLAFRHTPTESWKSFFDANDLFKKVSEKYNLQGPNVYDIKIKDDASRSPKKSLIDQLKQSN